MRYLASFGPALLLSAIAIACASSNTDSTSPPSSDGGAADAGSTASDGATAPTSCERNADCTDGPTCTEGKCINNLCQYEPLVCPKANECADNACDPEQNKCKTTSKADGTDCSVGSCKAGTCTNDPSCYGDDPQQFLHCDGTTYRDAATDLYETDRVTNYKCASGEVTKEVAYNFDPPAGANVTLSLSVTGADADLDLIVLEKDCTRKSTCANAAQGSGFAGVTAGTGTETVQFTAKTGTQYYVVVDGKVASPVSYHLQVACN